ncbi:MAG: hypothetical protein HUU35_02695 [Armatimonadetes bacterium]|nr:hypothetical protein [Armatimonadota bacterium]
MVLVYLLLLLGMMFFGGMLIAHNPEPVRYHVSWFGQHLTIESSLLELIGWSVVAGAVGMMIPYLRAAWLHAGERRHLERDTAELRQDNHGLRRDAENARAQAALLEARVAEAEERTAQLEAESQRLLTMRAEPPPRAIPSRWQRR